MSALNHAVGRRKTSIARVFFKPQGKGKIIVNKKSVEEYFKNDKIKISTVKSPFTISGIDIGMFDVFVNVNGGGTSGQSGAIKHAISRVIALLFPELRHVLKKHGFLSRDSRIKERKKYGLKAARRAPQFSKR